MISFLDAADLEPVDGKVMSIIAGLGVCVNLALAAVLGEHHVHGGQIHHGHDHDHSHGHGHEHGSTCNSATVVVHEDKNEDEEHHQFGHDQNSAAANGSNSESLSLLGVSASKCKTAPSQFQISKGKLYHYNSTSTSEEILVHINELQPHGHDHDHGHHDHGVANHDKKHEKEQHNHNHGPSSEIENMNLRAAYLHVLGDLALSIAVLIAGLTIMYKPSWQAADPLCTIFFSVLVSYSVIGTFKQSLSILMEETPPDISWDQVYENISSVKGVSNVHDLHIWSISQGNYAASVHLNAVNANDALRAVGRMCRVKFGIGHCTIQIQQCTVGVDEDNCFTCEEGEFDCCHMNGRAAQ